MRRIGFLRGLSVFLAVLLCFTSVSPAFASGDAVNAAETALAEELLSYSDLYPTGAFEFFVSQLTYSEGAGTVTLDIIRKGSTAGEATVNLKAVDVSAAYGQDYVLKVKESAFFTRTLEADSDAVTLTDFITSETEESPEDDYSVQPSTVVNVPDDDYTVQPSVVTDILDGEITSLGGGRTSGLRAVRSAWVGAESDRPDWRALADDEIDSVQSLMASGEDAINSWAADVEGVSYTMTFTDGEYKKSILIELKDDRLSETDEQVFFILNTPTVAVLGGTNTAYLNITDNDENEPVLFRIRQTAVTVNRGDGVAEVTVERLTGTAKFASVNVYTAALDAKPEIDYTPTEVELIFAQGVTERTFEVPICSGGDLRDSVQFLVKLDSESANTLDGSDQAVVTIYNDQADPLSEDPAGEDGTMSLSAVTGWTDTRSSVNVAASVSNKSNTNSGKVTALSGLDLSTADYITFTWRSNEGSTSRSRKEGSGCDEHTVNYTVNNRYTYVYVNGIHAWSTNAIFGNTDYTVQLTDAMKSTNASIALAVQTYGENVNATARISNIRIHYPGYTYTIYNTSGTKANGSIYDNNTYIEKVYTTQDDTGTLVENGHRYKYGNTIVMGQAQAKVLAPADNSTPTWSDSKTIYVPREGLAFTNNYQTSNKNSNNVSVSAGPNGNVYLAGYQLLKRGTTDTWSDIIKPDDFVFNKAFIDKYSKDYLYSNNIFLMRPHYEPYTAYVKFQNTDTSKAEYGNGFTTDEVVKCTMLDTFVTVGNAKVGYAVASFNLDTYRDPNVHASGISANETASRGEAVTDQSATTYKANATTFSASRYPKSSVANAVFNEAISNVITFTPAGEYTYISMNYTTPKITVKIDPFNNDKDKGEVAYIPQTGPSFAGNEDTPMNVQPVTLSKLYTFVAQTEDGYKTYWKDFTGDVNQDGIISATEESIVRNYSFVRTASNGDIFEYRPKLANSLIYYGFYPVTANRYKGVIDGVVSLVDTPVFGGKTTKKPINDAQVSVNGVSTTTAYNQYFGGPEGKGGDGYFRFEDYTFAAGENHVVNISYENLVLTASQAVNTAVFYEINSYDTIGVTNAQVFKNGVKTTTDQISNSDSTYQIVIATNSSNAALVARYATFRFYRKDGSLIGTPVVIDNGANSNGIFDYSFNPKTLGIPPGAHMTVQFTDQNSVSYFEHDMGFIFSQSLGVLSFLAGFRSPVSRVFDFIGNVSSAFDFGWDGDMDSSPMVKTEGNVKTLSFGFSFNYGSEDDQEEVEKEKAKEAAETGENTKNAAKDAVDDKDAKKATSEVSATVYVNFSFALAVRMGKSMTQEHLGEWYFMDMMLVVNAGGGGTVTIKYMTPIGIPVFVTFASGVSGEAIFVIQQTYAKKEYYISEATGDGAQVDIFDIDMNSATRKFDAYGKFTIQPYVDISAGAGFDMFNLSLGGRADFKFVFLTDDSRSAGKVDLSAYIQLKFLFFTKKWELARQTYNLFGNSSLLSYGNLFADNNYLYDSLDSFEIADRAYLNNRSGWNGGGGMSLSSVASSTGVTESTLMDGIYPYPDVKMAAIGGGKYLAVFIDDDPSRTETNNTAVYYTVYNGSRWSEPQILEDDGTIDDSPSIFDLGERGIMVAWSTANQVFGDDPDMLEVLNARDIHTSLFDKDTCTFGGIKDVTKSTIADTVGDVDPKIAYTKYATDTGFSEQMIIYYTKSEYSVEETGDEPVVGDVLNPYSVIAYRFYDFAADDWVSTYSAADKATIIDGTARLSNGQDVTEDNFDQYEQEWYGQGFLSLAPRVNVTENLAENGYWEGDSKPVITAYLGDTDPRIIESESIAYNDLALFVYTLDYDSNIETTNDRDIFLQIYDFEDMQFTHTIMITNDDVEDCNLRITRSAGTTLLGYLSGGALKVLDLTTLVKSDLGTGTLGSTTYYYIDKTDPETLDPAYLATHDVYSPPMIVAEDTTNEDGRTSEIAGFDLVANDNYIYAMWTRRDVTLKNGIAPDSGAAALPESQNVETQIYMSRYAVADHYLTEPIQVTDEAGANYSQIGFSVLDNGSIKAIGVKSAASTETLSDGTEVVSEAEEDRKLVVLDFTPVSKVTISDISVQDLAAGSYCPGAVTFYNEGFETLDDVQVDILDEAGNSVIYEVTTTENDSPVVKHNIGTSEVIKTFDLPGGRSYVFHFPVVLEEEDRGCTFTVVLKNGAGTVIARQTYTQEVEDKVDVTDLEVNIVERGVLSFSAQVVNNGSAPSLPQTFSFGAMIDDTSRNFYLAEIGSLGVGESKHLTGTITADFDTLFDPQIFDDGSCKGTAEFFASTESGVTANDSLDLYATPDQMGQMNAISSIRINDGSPIWMIPGDAQQVSALVDMSVYDTERYFVDDGLDYTNGLQVVWKISDDSVVQLYEGGYIVSLRTGTAYLTAYILPVDDTVQTFGLDDYIVTSNYDTLPRQAIKTETVRIIVRDVLPEVETGGSTGGTTGGTGGTTGGTGGTTGEGGELPAKTFNDVQPGEWYSDAVQMVTQRGLFQGTAENTFEPQGIMTRAMFATVLGRYAKIDPEQYTAINFGDVPSGEWFSPAIAWASEKGIVTGTGGDRFSPAVPITREQMAVMMIRFIQVMGIELKVVNEEEPDFADIGSVSDWAAESVRLAWRYGLMSGSNGSFRPDSTATRAEVAVVLTRFIESVEATDK